jgi:hypothetical protein
VLPPSHAAAAVNAAAHPIDAARPHDRVPALDAGGGLATTMAARGLED